MSRGDVEVAIHVNGPWSTPRQGAKASRKHSQDLLQTFVRQAPRGSGVVKTMTLSMMKGVAQGLIMAFLLRVMLEQGNRDRPPFVKKMGDDFHLRY